MEQTPDNFLGGAVTIAESRRLARLKARRKLWLDAHLYLGLIAGAILSVVGLTGSIEVFFVELQEILNAEQIVIAAPPQNQRTQHNLDDIVAAAETVKPQGSILFKVYYPRKPDVAYKLLYFVGNEKQANNGILAAISIISVLTGLIVWWPLTGKFKQALTFKRHAGTVRFNFDLHKTVGFYSTIVLLPVLFSGIYFNLPDQVNTLVNLFSPVSRTSAFNTFPPEIRSHAPKTNQPPISYAAVEAIVQQRYPEGRLWMLNAPKNSEDIYKVMKQNVDEVSRFIGYRDIAIDQYSGNILDVYEAGTGSAGDVFLDWQWPLHSGKAFGWTGRILVFLSGLACPVLYVTGVTRWLQKRRAKSCRKAMF